MTKKGKHSLRQIESFKIFPHGRKKLRYSENQSSLSIQTAEQVRKYYEEKDRR